MAENRPAGDGQHEDNTPPGGGVPLPPRAGAPLSPQAAPAGTGPAPGRPGAGFASGDVLDKALPGPSLAASANAAAGTGWAYDQMSDDELIGVLGAWQRTESWAAAGRLSAVAELNPLRPGHSGRHLGRSDALLGPDRPTAGDEPTGERKDQGHHHAQVGERPGAGLAAQAERP